MTASLTTVPDLLDTVDAAGRTARRAVLGAQMVASLGLAAGGAAGGLLAVAVTANDATAAAPLGSLVLGAGCSAPLAAAVMARRGRRAGLLAGYMAGALGAAVVVVGAAVASLPWLLAGNALLGAGNTAVMLSRYVVADLSPPYRRGRAISTSMLTITLGAVAGPNLLSPAGNVATHVGLPAPTGLYLLALAAFVLAPGLLVWSGRRSARRDAAGHTHRTIGPVAAGPVAAAAPTAPRTGTRRTAVAVLTTANIAMVGIMAVVPVHLATDGHGLGLVGLLVSVHIGAMTIASPLLGRLVDTHGSRRVALMGALLFAATGFLPVLVTPGLVTTSMLLVGLGLAWNTQMVAGSALLHEAVTPARRPWAEARGELAMSLGAAGASLLLAQPLLAAGGLRLLVLATVPMHLLLLPLLTARPGPHEVQP